MKTETLSLNFVRSNVAQKPSQEEIQKAVEKANKLYAQSAGRAFEYQI